MNKTEAWARFGTRGYGHGSDFRYVTVCMSKYLHCIFLVLNIKSNIHYLEGVIPLCGKIILFIVKHNVLSVDTTIVLI
jgi:hypothetical protein